MWQVRAYAIGVCAVVYAGGVTVAQIRKGEVHDNEHNWRAYIDRLAGNSAHVDGFNASCVAKYGSFSPPTPTANHQADFGHMLDTCWPPASDTARHPLSALTSLGFVLIGFLLSEDCIGLALAILGGGSFRHHAAGDASGRALDHSGVAAVAICLCGLVLRALLAGKQTRLLRVVANCATLCAITGIISAGNIKTNANIASYAAAGVALVAASAARIPVVAFNAVVPLAVGWYCTHKASPHWHHAECTGSGQEALIYDKLHSLWHLCVIVGCSEMAAYRLSPIAGGWSLQNLAFRISPTTTASLVLPVLASFAPEWGDIGAAVLLGPAAIGVGLQFYYKDMVQGGDKFSRDTNDSDSTPLLAMTFASTDM